MAYSTEQIEETFTEIITIISEEGTPVGQILSRSSMPSSQTFYKWLEDEDKAKRYARACEVRADTIFEEILEISDESNADVYIDDQGNLQKDGDVIQRARLRVDARKWVLSKMAPKKYGDKLDVTSKDEKIEGTTIINIGEGIDPKK